MKLLSLTVENYRSIEKDTLPIKEVSDSYTYSLIGINESGKSSFLEAISLKDGLKSVAISDFNNKAKPIVVSYEYELNDEDFRVLVAKLQELNLPADVLESVAIRSVVLKTMVLPSETTGIKRDIDIVLKNNILPKYTVVEGNIVERNDKTQTPLDLGAYFKDKLLNVFFDELAHKVVYWKSEQRFLITDPVNLDQFAADSDKTSIPLKNCFLLAGLMDVSAEISKLRADPAYSRDLQDRLEDSVTEHINKSWPEHQVSIAFKVDNESITFLVKDKGVKYETKTTSQRSDGFRQFVSFLLTISAQSATGKLSNTLLLLDEPEIHLHPRGQENLRDELIKITKNNANNVCIFATHSNYMIDKNHLDRCYMLKKEDNVRTKISPIESGKTTYAEVNYIVFGVAATDYHNELYGYLEEINDSGFNALPKKMEWKNKKTGDTWKVSLPAFVRHSIHHPENTLNKKFTLKELDQSINILRELKEKSTEKSTKS